MIAEIISTGNEVLCGAVVDSNAAFIAEMLEAAGIEVKRQTCVGDDIDDIAAAVGEAANRTDIVTVTGGLGPTGDDVTAEAVARAAGVELELNPDARASIEAFFASRGLEMRLTDHKQAMLPQGADCIANPVGTAPAMAVIIGNCTVFVLPGVPHEMETLLTGTVLGRIETSAGGPRQVSAVRQMSVFGLPESEVGRLLMDFPGQFPLARYGIRVKFPEIYVSVSTKQPDRVTADAVVDEARDWVGKAMAEAVVSVDGLALETEVGRLLGDAKKTVAVAESCTGGLLADLLTGVPGSSDYFLFSGVTYANSAKVKVLGVPEATLEDQGAVSEETARAMARGVRNLTGATYGLSTSGIAGPGGGTADKPVGTVCIGLATPETVSAVKLRLSFQNRAMNKRIFAFMALDLLRRELLGRSR